MQVILLTHTMKKKKNNMGICNYKAQNSSFRRKNMIHTSKDAQATAAICSCGPNPWKSKSREAKAGWSTCWTPSCTVFFLVQDRNPLWEAEASPLREDRPVAVLTHQWWDEITRLSLACSRPCKDSLLPDCCSCSFLEVRVSMEKFWISLIPPKLSSGSACNQREILVLKLRCFL